MSISLDFSEKLIDKAAKIFFWFMLFEIFIGGAGRLLDFNGITLRMVCYVVSLGLTFFLMLKGKKIHVFSTYLITGYLLLTFCSIILGILNGADFSFLSENVLMSSFFLTFPFFSIMIRELEDVQNIIKLYKVVSVILAIIYLGFVFALINGIIPFEVAYRLTENPEIKYRGENAIFYKGFLFMCCGVFFLFSSGSTTRFIFIVLTILAIVLTFVRGFVISIVGTYIFYFIFLRNILYGVIMCFLVVFALGFASEFYYSNLGDRSEADFARVIQFREAMERMDIFSWILGKGYGIGVPEKPNHFEINFLEILYKQGMIGLIFWLSMLVIVIFKFISAKRVGNQKLAAPFLLACIFLYIQSMTNPFLTNSMGMTIMFTSILSLDILSKKRLNV